MAETGAAKVLDSSHIVTIEKLLSGMRYGNITIIVQDGRIIQIDKTEKYRI